MKEKIYRFLSIVLGNGLIAFAVSTLILDNKIIAGGISGVGIVLNHYLGLSISISVALINIVLLLLGYMCIGKKFAMTSLVSTFIFPILLDFFSKCDYLHNYLEDPLLSSVLAGFLIGIGIGIILKNNASTGGIDILALIVSKTFHLPVHIVLNVFDLAILALQLPLYDTTHVIYGMVTIVLTSVMLNQTLKRGTSLIQLTIMSDSYEEIRNMILHDHDAGVTLLASEKGYTKENSKLLLSVIPYRKLPSIKEQVHRIDPQAFMIVSHIDEVGGRGFSFERRVITD